MIAGRQDPTARVVGLPLPFCKGAEIRENADLQPKTARSAERPEKKPGPMKGCRYNPGIDEEAHSGPAVSWPSYSVSSSPAAIRPQRLCCGEIQHHGQSDGEKSTQGMLLVALRRSPDMFTPWVKPVTAGKNMANSTQKFGRRLRAVQLCRKCLGLPLQGGSDKE